MTRAFHIAQEFATVGRNYHLDLNAPFLVSGVQHTALTYIIAEQKNIQTFGKLHELGADVNKGDSNGFTPLIHYIRLNKLTELQALLRDFKIDTRKPDAQGRTIIHHAVRSGEYASFENVDLLNFLATHEDINRPDNRGFTPLDYANLQESGRMKAALEKLGGRANQSSIRRAPTSMLNELEFPSKEYNFEEDFERFLEDCKTKADNNKQTFTDKIPVDHNAVGNYEVVYENGEPFDTYMVKVEISYGYYSGNTFYKMQILREKVRDIYILFTKWGRVGTDGQYQQTPFSKLDDAKKEWCSIFKSKSGNDWENRHQFVKQHKKYRLVPFVFKNEYKQYIKALNYVDTRLPNPKTPKPIYKLLRRVLNLKWITNALEEEHHLDTTLMPLHMIKKQNILQAEQVLERIAGCIQAFEAAAKDQKLEEAQKLADELTKYSNEFYELLPNSKFKDRAMPPIKRENELKQAALLVKNMLMFEVSSKMIAAASLNAQKVHPVDYCYNVLGCKITPMQIDSDEFKILKLYMNNGGKKELITFLKNIYAVERPNERDNIKKWEKHGNKMLLWHGTKPENVVGILQTGFRIAPADTNHSGAMFGNGVYFADMIEKAWQYSSHWRTKYMTKYRYLLLCEVALGKSKQVYSSENV